MNPLVSVVILSHRADLLPEALASVLAQDVPNVQVIVQHAPERWMEKLNEAAGIARGEYLAILCEDDALAPGFLAATIAAIRHGYDIAYTDRAVFGDADYVERAGAWAPEAFATHAPVFITALMRTALWRSLGGFDAALTFADWDFWYRAWQAGAKAVRVPQPLFRYRIHERQDSHTIDFAAATAEMYRAHPELQPPPVDTVPVDVVPDVVASEGEGPQISPVP